MCGNTTTAKNNVSVALQSQNSEKFYTSALYLRRTQKSAQINPEVNVSLAGDSGNRAQGENEATEE